MMTKSPKPEEGMKSFNDPRKTDKEALKEASLFSIVKRRKTR